MKYKLFRSPGDLDKSVLKHELVAVEYGKDIYDVRAIIAVLEKKQFTGCARLVSIIPPADMADALSNGCFRTIPAHTIASETELL